MQDYKDGSGLQFIKFDFMTGGQEITTILVQLSVFNRYFVSQVHISLPLPFKLKKKQA